MIRIDLMFSSDLNIDGFISNPLLGGHHSKVNVNSALILEKIATPISLYLDFFMSILILNFFHTSTVGV